MDDEDDHWQGIKQYGEQVLESGEKLGDKTMRRHMSEALYAMSEASCWPDNVDSVSEEQAFMIIALWRRFGAEDGFPDHLKP